MYTKHIIYIEIQLRMFGTQIGYKTLVLIPPRVCLLWIRSNFARGIDSSEAQISFLETFKCIKMNTGQPNEGQSPESQCQRHAGGPTFLHWLAFARQDF